jgi:hypothetical protein
MLTTLTAAADASGVAHSLTWAEVIVALIALIAAAASAAAYFKAQLSRSTIEVLQQSNAALTERVSLLEDEGERNKIKIRALEDENHRLLDYVSGTEAIKELSSTVQANHFAVMGRLDVLTGHPGS